MSTLTITLTATTVGGEPLNDPRVVIVVHNQTTGEMLQPSVCDNFAGSAEIVRKVTEVGHPLWVMKAYFTRFDGTHVPFPVFPATAHHPAWNIKGAVRLPNEWTPRFTPLLKLAAPRFDPLREVIGVSDQVDLKNGGEDIRNLQASYDGIDSHPGILAKAALLNLYAVLLDGIGPANKPWFSYVKKFVRLNQERIVAEVDPDLLVVLRGIRSGTDGYHVQSSADYPLHYPNIPSQYGGDGTNNRPGNLKDMFSIKKSYQQGDLQLTVSVLRFPGRPDVHLLDCDLDENESIPKHLFDLLKHIVNGGTNPVFMHEYIEKDSANTNGGIAKIDFGYTLVPVEA